MKTDYDLMPGETVLVETEQISRYLTQKKKENGKLILTNQRIMWITKTLFGKVKDILSFPIKDIGMFNDQANVSIKEGFDEPTVLTIHFNSALEKYEFYEGKKVAKTIANQINRMVTGVDMDLYSEHQAIPGVGLLAGALKGTFDTFKDTFVGRKTPDKVTVRCLSCGASVTGYKGQVVKCPYCGNVQNV